LDRGIPANIPIGILLDLPGPDLILVVGKNSSLAEMPEADLLVGKVTALDLNPERAPRSGHAASIAHPTLVLNRFRYLYRQPRIFKDLIMARILRSSSSRALSALIFSSVGLTTGFGLEASWRLLRASWTILRRSAL